ncbi:flagellar hook-associated protein FlgK [Aeromonas diversa]|uniref:flagellar hook-associated protein FlgK n=1 Tax=Aeromonas diversa TaxID=502790 RepID=UPI0034634FE4
MSLLHIGFSGLNAAQIALNVSAQNVANVNTPGYSRQEAMMGSVGGFGRLDSGAGVEVTGVRRITDDYLVGQQWRSGSAFGRANAYHQYINTTEQILGSESMNISLGLDSFFASLNAALDAPKESAQREQVVSSATALANRFNQLNRNLLGQEKQIADQLGTSVTQTNSYLSRVAALNKEIGELAAKGGNTALLEDSRDQVIRELSGLVEIRVTRQSNGDYDLSLPKGQPLVLGGSSSTFSLSGEKLSLSFGPQTFEVPSLDGGSMAGVIDYRDNVLRTTRTKLGEIAGKLADEFNAKQDSGLDLSGAKGAPMFTYDAVDPAGTLRVADGFKGEQLAFAKTGGGPGDNRNLHEMLTIKDDQYDAYSALLGRLAVHSGQAKADADSQRKLDKELTAKVSSVSGVNSDEEGMKVMAFTKAYQANAKVISTADQLFDALLMMF